MSDIVQIVNLSYIYEHLQELPWNYALYMESTSSWSPTTRCAVLNPGDVEDDEELPRFAIENSLSYVLSVADVQDVYENAKIQLVTVTIDKFIQSLNYYFLNDAFVNFTS